MSARAERHALVRAALEGVKYSGFCLFAESCELASGFVSEDNVRISVVVGATPLVGGRGKTFDEALAALKDDIEKTGLAPRGAGSKPPEGK